MAFPISPTDGQQNIVGNVTYQYSSADNSWTRIGGQVPTLSIAGNVSAGNIYSLGPVSAVGNVTGAYIIGNGSQLTGLPASYSNADVSNYLASGTDNANIITTGNVSGNFILGNGAFLSGVITSVANINNGTSNVTVVSSGGNITVGVSGVGNVAVFAPTGEYVTGVLSATGNITGNVFVGNGSGLTSITGANVTGTVANATYAASAGSAVGTAATVTTNAQPNITSVGTLTSVTSSGLISTTGNVVGGGVRTTTSSLAPTSPAPVVGDMWVNSDTSITYRYTYDGTSYFWEDFTGGGIATNADAIVNGTSNVSITQNSNVTVGIAGTTRAIFAGDTLYVASNIVPTSNNVFTLGSPTAQWASVYLSANTLYLGTTPLSANASSNTLVIGNSTVVTANPTGTSSTTGNMQVVGNVTGSNLLTSGLLSATGNIFGNVYIGNGAVLTSLTGSAVVGAVASATGALTAATVTTAAQPNITSVGTLSSLSVTANITGGNLITTGTASISGFTISANTITSAGPTLTIDPNASGGIDGNVVIQGNLVVNGNMTYINSNNITTNDLTINMANNAATATAANGGGIGVGPAGSEYISLTYNSASNIWVASNGLSVQGTIQGSGNISGNVHIGNGAGLTSLVGANITGTVANATYALSSGSAVGTAATVTTAAQPNITSVGTLTSVTSSGLISTTGNIVGVSYLGTTVSVSGNVNSGNVLTAGAVSATGNIISGNISAVGTVQDAAGDVRVIVQNAQTGNYGLVAADSGKHIYHATGAAAATYTIPANSNVAYTLGTAITFVNMSANTVSIAITSDTMYLAGTGSTGTRTLAQYGSATALKMTSTTWMISGAGLT